jgi:hypothetical protein
MDGQIPMVRREFPSAIFLSGEGFLVREEPPGNIGFRPPRRRVLRDTDNDDAIVPTRIFAGMKAGSEDCVFLHITKLLLPFEDSDLVLFENAPLLILMAILNAVYPLHDDRFCGRERDGLCLLHGRHYRSCGMGGEDEHGEEKDSRADPCVELHRTLPAVWRHHR